MTLTMTRLQILRFFSSSRMALKEKPDRIGLDAGLPAGDGFEGQEACDRGVASPDSGHRPGGTPSAIWSRRFFESRGHGFF
jgi:hypothetical protein